ncbi:hypothetical protein LTR62_003509 [Meristemomyces frigidus]|uniref:Uncharacterized protein n=1 Tax=Meristemomyces frigidus TaxID=1508187 RepID=A0AAN7YRT1_9PEZI|nr:hypothetical protein LTR62_003509 [Meristemomyces frigidus]
MAGKDFSLIALAALTTKLTIIDGVLMQRATSSSVRQDHKPVHQGVYGAANRTIPITGRTSDGLGTPGLMTQDFSTDLKAWAQSPTLQSAHSWHECNGYCFFDVQAAGLEFDCTEPESQAIAYGSETHNAFLAAANAAVNQMHLSTSETVFSISFGPQYTSPGTNIGANLTMDILCTFANDSGDGSDCPGTLYKQSCILRPAVITYPVFIKYDPLSSTDTTPRLMLGITYDLYAYGEYTPVVEEHSNGSAATDSYLAGLRQRLTIYLGGSSSIAWYNSSLTPGWQISQQGNAPQYLTNAPAQSQCGYIYADPINPDPNSNVQSVVAAISQIMWDLATGLGCFTLPDAESQEMNAAYTQYDALMLKPAVHYSTNTNYTYGAVASIIICRLLVLPVYWRHWELGRKVSLGPFEIAHAFRSPMTPAPMQNVGSIEQLMREVGDRRVRFGDRRVRFGDIVAGDAKGILGVAEAQLVAPMEGTRSGSGERHDGVR